MVAALEAGDRPLQPLLKEKTIGQARQGVVTRHVREAALRAFFRSVMSSCVATHPPSLRG